MYESATEENNIESVCALSGEGSVSWIAVESLSRLVGSLVIGRVS